MEPTNMSSFLAEIWNIKRPKELTTLQKLKTMASNVYANSFAKDQGYAIQTISWEDCGRSKNSSWGPNISDMTLQVMDENGEYQRMPVVRRENFSDFSHDISLVAFPVWVGNESGSEVMTRMTLKDYLKDISNYIKDGTIEGSLVGEDENFAINTIQACFLPAKEGENVNFNVALYNYQSYQGNPAVLTIVVSAKGASAQIIDNGEDFNGQKLSFNKEGKACDFMAERLKDVRANQGMIVEGALNEQEELNRKLLIVQIPLVVEKRPTRGFSTNKSMNECAFSCLSNKSLKSMSIDDAQISVGKETGKFDGVKGLKLKRDFQFPIRVTTQLYKIADCGDITREQMKQVTDEIRAEEEAGKDGSSLVVEHTNRSTEWIATKDALKI